MRNDYFSTQSVAYKRFRPTYPAALFDYLAQDLGPAPIVWDCATGNGQAAIAIASHAARVIASDQSNSQISQAERHDNVYYVQALAEQMPLPDDSADLITVAQAIHWFDFDRFFAEAKRVLKPRGKIAVWTYSFLAAAPQLGADMFQVVDWFYHDVVGPYWPVERRWVDEAYETLPFPFKESGSPAFTIEAVWSLTDLLGYVSSWSAVARYIEANGVDPMLQLADKVTPLWGEPDSPRKLHWDLGLRIGTNV